MAWERVGKMCNPHPRWDFLKNIYSGITNERGKGTELYSVYDLPVYMIYRCKFKTLDFLSLDFLTSSSFLSDGHKNSLHLSETVKIVSVSEFDVKMINNFIAFDFPFRIICASYQIHRQHPWIRKKLYYKTCHQRQILLITFPDVFQDMYHIIFVFGKIYLSILALISVCTGRSYYVTTERAHMVVSILTSKM